MDPISSIRALASVVSYLLEVAKTMKENKTECQKLCEHTRHILDIIQNETKGNVPPKLELRLGALLGSLEDITAAVKELSSRSFLKRALWRKTISAMIQSAYTQIEKVMQEFKFVALIDLTKMQHEHEVARQLDSTNVDANFQRVLRNDQDIITLMQIHSKQMQEAMLSLHQHLSELPASSERKVLEHGLHAMQRRSGRMKMIPDEFVITSLDVIIHQDRKLGAGGFAEVFEADWRGTRVAVKILEKGLPASAIQQEVNVWKRLRHPCILEFFGACPIADPPFMVCAYKENGDAVEYLRHFPDNDRRQLLSQSAQGLDYLHSNNVIHGDLKATNILIDSHGKACLSDFGLSRVKTQTATIRMTKEQQTQAGTVRWMAPEHMLTGVANKKTDIYSFAMTMYEIFTLVPPFASTPESILFTIVCDRGVRPPRPDDPEVEEKGFDDILWALVTKCWAQGPNDRLDASSVAEQLAEICTKPLRIAFAAADLDVPIDDKPFGDGEPLIRSDDDSTAAEGQLEQQWDDLYKSLESFGISQEVIEQDRGFIKDFVADAQSSQSPATGAVNGDSASLQSQASLLSPQSQASRGPLVLNAGMARAASPAKRSPQGPRPPISRRFMDETELKTSSKLQQYVTPRPAAPPTYTYKEAVQNTNAEDRLGPDVTAPPIPPHPKPQLDEQRLQIETRNREREEQHLYLYAKVITDETFSQHEGFDLATFDEKNWPASELPTFRVLRSETYSVFKARIARHFNYPHYHIRLWVLVSRQNKTVRVDTHIPENDPDLTLESILNSMASRKRDLKLYLEVIPDPSKPEIPVNSIMIFLKHFDTSKQTLSGVGKVHVSPSNTVGDLASIINERMRWSPGTPHKLYEEIKSGMIELMKPRWTFRQSEIQDGDIICFQVEINDKEVHDLEVQGLYSNPIQYYDFLANRVMIVFRPKFEEAGHDQPEFGLGLSKKHNYDMMSLKVGEFLRYEPIKMRFTTTHAADGSPKAVVKRSLNQSVAEIISAGYFTTTLILYEKLDASIVEYEVRGL